MSPTVLTEYEAIANRCGLLEHEAHAFIDLTGAGAAEFLQGQITNDIEGCPPGNGVYAALLTPKGRIQMDLRVLRTETGALIDCDLDRLPILKQTIQKFSIGYKFDTVDQSEEMRLFALIGPLAGDIAPNLPAGEHSHLIVQVAGIGTRAVRTNWGIDLFVPEPQIETVRTELLSAGATVVGWDAAEIRRVELGRPRLGFEFDHDEIPQEVRLNDAAVNFEKGCYVGQETVARLFYKGKPNRLLQGLRLDSLVRQRDPVFYGERQVGQIGTAVESPRQGAIALAVLRHEVTPGDQVSVGESQVSATVTEPAALAPA